MSFDLTAEAGRAHGTFNSGIAAETAYTMFGWFKRDTKSDSSFDMLTTLTADKTATSSYVTMGSNLATQISVARTVGGWTSSNITVVAVDVDVTWVPYMLCVADDGANSDTDAYVIDVSHTYSNNHANWISQAINGILVGDSSTAGSNEFDGLISHVCIWEGVKLTEANFTSLAAGIVPTTIETANVHSYYPLIDDLADASGNSEVTLTAAGTTAFSADEPFVVGGSIPVISHHLRMNND